ncbi:hypothetical protein LWI28_006863 [Acer negundo]|uniref:Uncharacterized protein n=1 Tax=Acer negundo TaxID=4023 RepID=A0AAD5IBU6_ACENE|nr:hypothetical protein LWI28_006863 [Acer negundo]
MTAEQPTTGPEVDRRLDKMTRRIELTMLGTENEQVMTAVKNRSGWPADNGDWTREEARRGARNGACGYAKASASSFTKNGANTWVMNGGFAKNGASNHSKNGNDNSRSGCDRKIGGEPNETW